MCYKHPKLSNLTKAVDIDFHYVREQVLLNNIEVKFVPTGMQIADVFTKMLTGALYRQMAEALLNYEASAIKRTHRTYENERVQAAHAWILEMEEHNY